MISLLHLFAPLTPNTTRRDLPDQMAQEAGLFAAQPEPPAKLFPALSPLKAGSSQPWHLSYRLQQFLSVICVASGTQQGYLFCIRGHGIQQFAFYFGGVSSAQCGLDVNTTADLKLREPEAGCRVPSSLQGLSKGDWSCALHGRPMGCSYFSVNSTKCHNTVY